MDAPYKYTSEQLKKINDMTHLTPVPEAKAEKCESFIFSITINSNENYFRMPLERRQMYARFFIKLLDMDVDVNGKPLPPSQQRFCKEFMHIVINAGKGNAKKAKGDYTFKPLNINDVREYSLTWYAEIGTDPKTKLYYLHYHLTLKLVAVTVLGETPGLNISKLHDLLKDCFEHALHIKVHCYKDRAKRSERYNSKCERVLKLD